MNPPEARAISPIGATLLRRRLLAAGLAAVVATGILLWLGRQGPSAPGVFPASGALFGAHVGFDPAVTDRRSAQEAFDDLIGRTSALDRQFYRWDEPWPTADDAWSRDRGSLLFLSWKARRTDGTFPPWAAIASGALDGEIDQRAAAIAAFGSPIVFSFHHEPEGDPAGSPADYVAAYRHVRERFLAAGLTKVVYAWTLSASSFRTGVADAYYPGDDAVDVVAADGYNWAFCPNRTHARWQSFASVFGAFHAFGVAHGKPMVVAEWGAHEDPGVPGRKAAWIADAAAQLRDWPEIRGVAYFDVDRACPRKVDSSTSALDAFRAMGTDPYFSGVPLVNTVVGRVGLEPTTDGL